jgi:imidazolonepropionase-like amidohydrolase
MRQGMKAFPMSLDIGKANLARAYKAGVTLVTGSDAGNLLVFHGPTIQRELQLWKEAGIPAQVSLQAATYNAARLLHAENRIGFIRPGLDADLVIVDGNPLDDIQVAERISMVIFKGERVDRSELFHQK